jgi:hypothetical protein
MPLQDLSQEGGCAFLIACEVFSVCVAACLVISGAAFGQHYSQTNLVSDIPGLAAFTDKNLVNAWGIAFGQKSPFWIADNGTGVSTLYNANGSKVALTVTIPPPEGGSHHQHRLDSYSIAAPRTSRSPRMVLLLPLSSFS